MADSAEASKCEAIALPYDASENFSLHRVVPSNNITDENNSGTLVAASSSTGPEASEKAAKTSYFRNFNEARVPMNSGEALLGISADIDQYIEDGASFQSFTARASGFWRYVARRSSFALDSVLNPQWAQQETPSGASCRERYRLAALSPTTGAAAATMYPINSNNLKSLSCPAYVLLLLTHFFSPDVVKQKLSRLTFMEALEHFDLFNDLFFLVRVAWAIHRGLHWHENRSAKFVMSFLLITYVISCCAYALRRYLIYNRVPPNHAKLFYPFLVFKEIRRAGEDAPEVLFMFERLCWTYQLLMRVIEDLPQVLCSILFLINQGKDTYAMMMIAYSSTLFLITTIRMGLRYPFKGTFYLLLSSEPPIGDPVALEAAPTTYFMTLFMGGVFALWCCTYFLALRYANKIWRVLILVLGLIFGLLSVFCLILFAYYRHQSAVNVDEAFLGYRVPAHVDDHGSQPETAISDG